MDAVPEGTGREGAAIVVSGGRQPDFTLNALNKATAEKWKVGAGWKNADGSLSVKLNPFVVLTASTDLVLTMFPVNARDKAEYERAGGKPATPPPAGGRPDGLDKPRTTRARRGVRPTPPEEQPDIPF